MVEVRHGDGLGSWKLEPTCEHELRKKMTEEHTISWNTVIIVFNL